MHVFKGNVIHDGKQFVKGQECPKSLHDEMHKKGLIEALPEAVKPAPEEKKEEPKKSEDKKSEDKK